MTLRGSTVPSYSRPVFPRKEQSHETEQSEDRLHRICHGMPRRLSPRRRHSREVGPSAIVPILPSAVSGATMIFPGLFRLPMPVPWWACLLAFFGATAVFGFFISMASGRRKAGKRSNRPFLSAIGDGYRMPQS
jgi:hypothetical protein